MRVLCAFLLALLVAVPTSGAGITAGPSLATLLARHAPILVLHPGERFQPMPVGGFLADSDVMRRTTQGWEKIEGSLPRGGAALRLDQRLCRADQGVAATPCYVAAQAAHNARPVTYAAAFRRGDRIDLQYWFFYAYNPYSPTSPPGELWQVHEGDWEAVSVVLDRRGTPIAAGYSQHSEGMRRAWSQVPKRGLHPLVYVALGSHANYFSPGRHVFDPRVINALFISIIRQNGFEPVDLTARGRSLQPRLVRVTVDGPSWMTFAGRWGEDEYIRVPGGSPIATGGAGPQGPAFHEQWRAPVAEVLSWPRG
jgi:hypothetical protein